MKPTNFARYLTEFLTTYLSEQKNVSKNTIFAYRDTFKLLLKYCQEVKGIAIERISIDVLSAELIKDFLTWLETGQVIELSESSTGICADECSTLGLECLFADAGASLCSLEASSKCTCI